MMNRLAECKDADDLNDLLNEVYEDFLESLQDDSRFVREVREDDCIEDGEFAFMYTRRGARLTENIHRRLMRLAFKMYPNSEFEIDSPLCREY